jgi:hypothetical protein
MILSSIEYRTLRELKRVLGHGCNAAQASSPDKRVSYSTMFKHLFYVPLNYILTQNMEVCNLG